MAKEFPLGKIGQNYRFIPEWFWKRPFRNHYGHNGVESGGLTPAGGLTLVVGAIMLYLAGDKLDWF